MATLIPIDQGAVADFCRRNHIRKLSIFGSAIRDDFRRESDVDVLVEFDPEYIPGPAFVGMQEELAQMVGQRVDLSTPGFLSPYIRDRVMQEALVLYDETRLRHMIEAAERAVEVVPVLIPTDWDSDTSGHAAACRNRLRLRRP